MKKRRDMDERLPQPDLFGGAGPGQAAAPRPPPSRARSAAMAPARGDAAPPPPLLLNVRQAAARLGLSKSTLDKMRCTGKGPRYVKSTDRAVRYDPDDLEAWIATRKIR